VRTPKRKTISVLTKWAVLRKKKRCEYTRIFLRPRVKRLNVNSFFSPAWMGLAMREDHAHVWKEHPHYGRRNRAHARPPASMMMSASKTLRFASAQFVLRWVK